MRLVGGHRALYIGRMRHLIPFLPKPPLVSVLRLSGMIAAGPRGTLSDAALAPLVERAFRRGRPRAVALILNSPGGSPVQSSLIAARIRRLADQHKLPVHAFVEDVAASGGYWLATAADDIWVDPVSVVGSIGVIAAGFGFHELIARHGIERRVHTAGTSKSFLDPFRPERPEDVARLDALIEPMHRVFIDQVKARRGTRLAADRDLFNGDIWLGQGAVDVGLADGVGHAVPRLKEIYGDKVRLVAYGPRRSLFQRLAAEALTGAVDAAGERALRARYGL
jgi:serine protease SohB